MSSKYKSVIDQSIWFSREAIRISKKLPKKYMDAHRAAFDLRRSTLVLKKAKKRSMVALIRLADPINKIISAFEIAKENRRLSKKTYTSIYGSAIELVTDLHSFTLQK